MTSHRLATTSWPRVAELRAAGPVTVLVPIGSCEQHGPHLPFTVDATIAESVAGAAAGGHTNVIVAPVLSYGASGEHAAFPGTLSIGHEALHVVLIALARSATEWADRVVFVNAHGGNIASLRSATAALRREGRDVAWWPVAVPGGDAHAGHTETSLMLEVQPSVVEMEYADVGNLTSVAQLMPAMAAGGVATVSPNGVLGDPRHATAAAGRTIVAELASTLAGDLQAWQIDATGRLAAIDPSAASLLRIDSAGAPR